MNKVSFSWKPTISGREKWRWGLFMLVPSRSGRSNRLRIMVRGLLLWLGGIALTVYLGLASAWFLMLERRAVNYVTFADCLLAPLRWDDIEIKRGEAYVDEGLAAMQERKWGEAELKIRSGLELAPHHWKGRRSLSVFYVLAGQRDRGVRLLRDGFESFYPGRDAVEFALRIALAGENYAAAVELLDQVLRLSGAAVERDRDILIDEKCRVLVLAKQYEENLAWIRETGRMTDVRHESKVVSLIELGRFDEAREALADWQRGSGVLGGVRRLTVRLEREAGNREAMRAALADMQSRSPRSADPWIYGVVQEFLAGEPAAAIEAWEVFLMRFGNQRQDIARAANPLQQIEAWELFDRLMAHAEEMGMTSSELLRAQVESNLQRDRLEEARSALDRYRAAQRGTPSNRELIWYEIAKARIDLMESEDAAMADALAEILTRADVDLAMGRRVVDQLESQGRLESAQRIAQGLARVYPNSQRVAQSLRQLDAKVGQQSPRQIVLPEIQDGQELKIDQLMEEEAENLPDQVALAMRSSRRFLALAQDYVEEGRWAELDLLMSTLRRTRPTWVGAHQQEIRDIELELNIGDRNWPALVTNVRLQVDGTLDRALAMLQLARRVDAMGERTTAERVVAEIERRHQDFPPTERIREEWAAESAAETSAVDAPRETEAAADVLPVAE